MKHCPFCKAKIEDKARFCLTCMSSLDEKQAWRAPRRHNRRWQKVLAAVLAISAATSLVLQWPNKQPSLPADAPSDSAVPSASESSVSTSAAPPSGTTTPTRAQGTTTTVERATGTKASTSGTSASTNKTATQTTAVPDTFVPDYRPGYANTVGTTMQVAFNNTSGIVAKQDQWLYYSDTISDDLLPTLNKIRIDGTGQQTIANFDHVLKMPKYLNVIGDWIYFISQYKLLRMRTDGSRVECLYERKASMTGLYVTEKYGYFCVGSNYYRIDLKTKQIEDIASTSRIRYLSEEKDVLIKQTAYIGSLSEIQQCALSSPDTIQWTIQSESSENSINDCLVAGNTLFYVTKNNIYSADLRSAAPVGKLLFKQQAQNTNIICYYSSYKGGVLVTENLNVDNHRGAELYFMDGTTGFIEGTSTGGAVPAYTFPYLYNFDDDYVYYFKDDYLYRANADLSNPVQLTK